MDDLEALGIEEAEWRGDSVTFCTVAGEIIKVEF